MDESVIVSDALNSELYAAPKGPIYIEQNHPSMRHDQRKARRNKGEMPSSESRRRGRDGEHCHDNAAAKRPRRRQKKHLYLVMDDWDLGYSIHKLDVDAPESSDANNASEPRRLPEPSAVRIAAPEDRSTAYFAALGSKILAVTDRYVDEDPMLVYDTETASLAVGPRPTPALLPLGFIFLVAIEDDQHQQRLYALNPRRADQQRSFEVVSLVPRGDADERAFPLPRRADRWAVESVPAPMPFDKHDLVTAHSVHPDGRTVFVSARNRSPGYSARKEGTWSFDTRSAAWTWHGEWLLPFRERGYYVDEMDAWVGLRRDGFICSCDVASGGALPEWKIGKETMFREKTKRHVGQPGPTLTYLGDGRFCIVECAARQGVAAVDAMNGEVDGCVLHFTVFSVKYDNTGGLQTTVEQSSRSYVVSRYSDTFAAQAFWM